MAKSTKAKRDDVAALVGRSEQVIIQVLGDKPAFLAQHIGPARGLEQLEQSDLTLPRLSLCQSGSPQRKKQNAKYISGLEEGEFFNSITNERYGVESLFVPLFSYKARIKFIAFEEGGGIDCQSFNSKTGGRHSPKSCTECVFSQFVDEKKPECDLIYNYPGIVISSKAGRDLAVLSLKSTAIKVAKQFNSLMSLRDGADAFAGVYRLTAAGASAKGNDYQAVQIANAGWTDERTFMFAEATYNNLRGKKIEVDDQEGGRRSRDPGEDDI